MSANTWETGFQQLGDGIYCYITNGKTMMSNCMLVTGDECALVFDVLCTKPLTEAFLQECRRLVDKPIRYLVISHCHGDHFLGANALPEAIVIGHHSLKAAFDQDRATPRMEAMQKRLPHLDFTDATYPYPQIYLTDGCSIDLGNRMVEIRAMGKCHTEGDLALWIPDAKWMALADVLFHNVVPPTISGDIDHWIEVLEGLEQCEAEHFLPGHGPVCGREDVRAMREYRQQVRVQAQLVADGALSMKDEIPSPLEERMIQAGWLETARTIFSTEQYAAKIKGVPYRANMPRVLAVEASRNR